MADEQQSRIIFTAEDRTRAVFDSLRGNLDGLGSSVSQATGLMTKLAAAFGVGLSGAAFVAGVRGAADAADAAAKMGDRFGIATEQMIGTIHAADLAGVSTESLSTALRGISKSAVEAAMGNEAARTAYQRMGIAAQDFLKLPMDQQLSTVIDKLGQMENAAVRNATAQAVMGRQAGEVMRLVADGSEAFAKARDDAEAWGLAIDRIDAAKIEMANDAMKRAEAASKGVFTQIAVSLSPAVVALGNYFADTTAQARGYREEISQGSEIVIQSVGYMSNFVQGLKFVWTDAKLAVAEFLEFGAEGFSKFLGVFKPEWGKELHLFAESVHDTVVSVNADLVGIIEAGLPADRVIANTRKIIAETDDAAKQIAANRQKFLRQGDADLGVAPFDQYTARLAQQLEALLQYNRTEMEALGDHYAQRQALLDESVERGIITQEFWEGQSVLLFARYEQDKTKLLDEEIKKRYGISNVYRQLDASSASAWFGQMAQMMTSHNKTAFEIGKAAAISQTIIDTYRAAQGAFAAFANIPYVGPALGAAAAAAAIVAGLARVQQIRATQFGATTATPVYNATPTTGVPTAPISSVSAAAPAAAPTEIHVTIVNNGTMIGESNIQQFVEQEVIPVLSDAIDNRDHIIIGQNSRQALQLLPA